MEGNRTRFRSHRPKTLLGALAEGLRMPFLEATSPTPGPTVWLTACAHGEEVGGTVIIHEVFRRLRRAGLFKGQVMALPLMNLPGFEARRREIPYTSEDLNRCFPGDPNGTLGRRLAHGIFERISRTQPAIVLDLHNDWIRSIPYGLLEPLGEGPVMETCKTLLKASGILMIRDDEDIKGALATELVRRGIPALTLELGESHLVNEAWVAFGVESVLMILAHLGMYPAELCRPPALGLPAAAVAHPLTYANRPFANANGIIRYRVRPGELVRPGQPLASIFDPLGHLMGQLKAPGAGVLLGHADSAVVFEGMPVLAFGLFA